MLERFTRVEVMFGKVIVFPVLVVITFVDNVGFVIDGVVRIGDVAKTNRPEPVSSDIVFFSCKDVVAANCERLVRQDGFNLMA